MKPAQTRQKIDAPASWAELPWGEYYRAAIELQLEPWWPKFFGFHLLKIGHLSAEIASDKCAISHQVNVGEQGKNMQVLASPYQLPFAGNNQADTPQRRQMGANKAPTFSMPRQDMKARQI